MRVFLDPVALERAAKKRHIAQANTLGDKYVRWETLTPAQRKKKVSELAKSMLPRGTR